MYYVNVKQACRKYMYGHATGNMDFKPQLWQTISTDMDVLHNAQSATDCYSRSSIVIRKWKLSQVHETTPWTVRAGLAHAFVQDFQQYWLGQLNEFWWECCPNACATTINQAHLCVKQTRIDAGGVVSTVAAAPNFMVEQIRFESRRSLDPHENKSTAT